MIGKILMLAVISYKWRQYKKIFIPASPAYP